MHRHPTYTRNRCRQLIERIGRMIYARRQAVDKLEVAGPVDRISYDQAQQLKDFRPVEIGELFGPPWSTHWFRVQATVPDDWAGQRVDLLWDSQSEATLWIDGRSVQGLNMTSGDRPEAILYRQAAGGESVSLRVEMACNRPFGDPHKGEGVPNPRMSRYQLRQCEIALFDPEAWQMYYDAVVLAQLEKDLANEGATADRSWQGYLLAELNRFANTLDEHDRATWPAAAQILKHLYENKNASRVFQLSAIGHAHIDTAWLWPIAETHRKCERSFSTAVAYMEDYPEYRFSCSQAYQYDVIQRRNPDLYARIKAAAERGQWVPVGGTWIEPDCNIPSGEALCRQFLVGQRFFERAFGRRCKEFWNPDVFGYNGQLPQILREAGIKRFLTQKLSWNKFNTPEHHTFTWRGIDGSEVVTHFPPADTYNDLTEVGQEVAGLRASAAKFRDTDRANEGITLFGYGDGGGGPTRRMLEIIRRAKDLQAVPPTQQRSSDEFFDRLEADCTDLPVRVGELYFEYHRGTYTSQALIKRNNRKGEVLLHDLEFLAARNAAADGSEYPADQLDALWKTLLLNAFHDILPGSSIEPVYRDSEEQFEAFFNDGKQLLDDALGAGESWVNTVGIDRVDVVETGDQLQLVSAKPYASAEPTEPTCGVTLEREGEDYRLDNAHLSARITPAGHVVELVCKHTGRNVLAGPANVMNMYHDHANAYEAWDIDPFHAETRRELPGASEHAVQREDPLRVELSFTHPLSDKSRMTQTVSLDADAHLLRFDNHVDWRETRQLLKVAFPVDARAMDATYEMQFGHVQRPTHYNTSFDLARFEVPMHRWFDFSEPGAGLAVLNDCKYGGSTFDNVMRLTLLRAPNMPDPTCDRGEHTFAYALMPHAGDWRAAGVVQEAIAMNHPLHRGQSIGGQPFASVDAPELVLDTIKRSEDGQALIVRLYEAHGRRGEATLQFATPPKKVTRANVLEDPGEEVAVSGDGVKIGYTPFQLITLRCEL